MNNRQYIFEATKIIEDKLKEDLSVKYLSDRIGYSLFHFIRLFHAVVGCTPGEYITARRLCRAAQDLLSRESKIIDIALEYQFSTPESFSRAFKKHSGFTPSAFRKSAEIRKDLSRLPWVTPFFMDKSDLDGREVDREPQIVELGEMLLAGRMVEVHNDYKPIGRLWNQFVQLQPPAGASIPLNYAQLAFWDDNSEDDALFVIASVMADRMEENDSFIYKKVAPARYLRFPHYGPEHRISETYFWLFSQWIPETDLKLTLPYNMELYPPQNDPVRENGVTAWILLPLCEI